MDLEQVLDFVDENFKEIGVSSVIVPEKKSLQKSPVVMTGRRNSESCHLIGKVNPNILRTWEQLNLCQSNDQEDEMDVQKKNDLFFDGNGFDVPHEELASFKVNYVTYDRMKGRKGAATSTEDVDLYYDSIDEDEDQSSSEMSRSNAATFELSSGTAVESIIYRGRGEESRTQKGVVLSDNHHQQSSLMTDSTDQYLQGDDPLARGEGMAEFDSEHNEDGDYWGFVPFISIQLIWGSFGFGTNKDIGDPKKVAKNTRTKYSLLSWLYLIISIYSYYYSYLLPHLFILMCNVFIPVQ